MGVENKERVAPDPQQWIIETFDLEKRFAVRQGLPIGMGWGQAHWLISTLIKYRNDIKQFSAVDKVSLKVRRGEMLGLLGPNGAGKTTLIKCLATLLKIDGGTAYVNGYDVATQPDKVRLQMNLVGSGHWVAFDWGMSITQNLHFFGSLYGLSKAERKQRIEHTLDLLGLSHLSKRTPMGLSSGERQRVLLAKGFMVKTPIFFLDEPTVGLDPIGAKDVREFIRNELLGKSDTSGILTTHRMAEAEALCSSLAIMNEGRVIAYGTPHELKRIANQRSILDVRGKSFSIEAVEAVKRMRGVTAAAVAPVGSDGIEESLRVHCENPDALAGPLVDMLRQHSKEITSLEHQEPTLEDAFIALTAKRLS